MSNKYIKQIDKENFIYPGNTLAEYDVTIIHDLKENSVSGATSGFTTSLSGSNLVVSFSYDWELNGAEPFISNDGKLNVLSLHMMTADKKYYKPWICVGLVQNNNTALTSVTGTTSFTITPAMAGVSSFVNGTYYYEIRFIGKRGIYAEEHSGSVVLPSPTPTMTVTPSPTPGLSPSPTPTPSATPASNINLAEIGSACRADGCPVTPVIRVYLDNADYAAFVANGYNFSGLGGGPPTSCTAIARNSDGSTLNTQCYFDGNNVSWKLTVGHFSYYDYQC
jgi:hypothetical protein